MDADRLFQDARQGSQTAFLAILKQYTPLIESLVSQYAQSNEEDDLRQEATIALYSALLSYREKGPVTFGLYAKICIRNRLISLHRKRQPEQELDEEWMEQLPASDESPEGEVLAREGYDHLLWVIDHALSDLEKRVLVLYLRELSYAEIARQLDVCEKTVDNAVYRLKAKLKKSI